MGKYMRKGRGRGDVAVMEVSQGSLGVRTRARALALEKDKKVSHSGGESFEPALSLRHEPRQISYLELRSRRLEKTVRCSSAKEQAGQSRGLRKAASECRLSDVTNSDMLDDCSSRLAHSEEARLSLTKLETSGASDRGRRNTDENRGFVFHLEDPLLSSVKGSLSASLYHGQSGSGRGRAPPGAAHSRSNSRSNSISHELSRGILTRNQRRQEQRISTRADDMEVDTDTFCGRGEADPSGNVGKNTEVEVSFGENPIDEGLSVKDKDSQTSHALGSCRRVRESTPSSHIREVETPGSATRPPSGRGHGRPPPPPDAPSLMEMEIEDFFADAERQEQRRFTERYNFDPVSDMPLPGRYEWFISLQP